MKPFCQSCGMPLREDPNGGGTEADGTRSTLYCSYCYVNGAFTAPDFTARQMQDFCVRKLQERGVWRPFAWLLTRNIPRLKRWKPA